MTASDERSVLREHLERYRLGIVPPFFAYALPPGMRPDVR